MSDRTYEELKEEYGEVNREVLEDIEDERTRQVIQWGLPEEHDDKHPPEAWVIHCQTTRGCR